MSFLSAREYLCGRTVSALCRHRHLLPPPHLIGKDHEAVVTLASYDATHALRRNAHGVEGEELALLDLVIISQILESGLQNNNLVKKYA